MSTAKPSEIILARQLASCLATPIVIVDAEGMLIFYNEPAEAVLNQRYDETGDMLAAEWGAYFAVSDLDRNPIPVEEWPLVLAFTKQLAVARVVWLRCGDEKWRKINFTAFPIIGQAGDLLGASNFPNLPREWTSGGMLAANADLLIHDSQYSAAEYPCHCGWGHSSLTDTLAFAALVDARRLVTFHHDPRHSDDDLDRLSAQAVEAAKPAF